MEDAQRDAELNNTHAGPLSRMVWHEGKLFNFFSLCHLPISFLSHPTETQYPQFGFKYSPAYISFKAKMYMIGKNV